MKLILKEVSTLRVAPFFIFNPVSAHDSFNFKTVINPFYSTIILTASRTFQFSHRLLKNMDLLILDVAYITSQ